VQAGDFPLDVQGVVTHTHTVEVFTAAPLRTYRYNAEVLIYDGPPPREIWSNPQWRLTAEGIAALAWYRLRSVRGENAPPTDSPQKPPTIWFHGSMSYSTDGGNPQMVSQEQHNVLQAFLDREEALGTKALEKAGVNNAAAAVTRLEKKFGGGVIHRPKRKGDGYFIRVRTKEPTG
jgi:hypothetical protein